jgi:hypothetical protein
MSRRILTLTVFSALAFSAGACNSALDPSTAPFAAGQGAGTPVADDKGGQRPAGVSDDSLPGFSGGVNDPSTNDIGDDNGVDNPATHDVGDDNGVDNPATHDVGDDNGVDNPATHDVGDDNGVDNPATHDVGDDHGGDRGDNGSGRGGADDPANHE